MTYNVLVVDDSAVIRTMLIKTLRLSGLDLGEVFEAANGRDGLKMLNEHSVDLALIDLNMPIMSGEEMIEEVRRNPRMQSLPIVVVSTESSQTRIEHVQKKGVEFIHKPFTPEGIREMVQRMTGANQ